VQFVSQHTVRPKQRWFGEIKIVKILFQFELLRSEEYIRNTRMLLLNLNDRNIVWTSAFVKLAKNRRTELLNLEKREFVDGFLIV